MENFEPVREKAVAFFKNIYDPEIPVNIYDLGLIYSIDFEKKGSYLHCHVAMTLTSPGCPVADSLILQVQGVAQGVEEIDEATVEITFDPPWSQEKVSEEGRLLLGL